MRSVHLVLPDGVDDPARPSGGNVYDRRVAEALRARGWRVVEHAVLGPWPWPDTCATDRLADALRSVPDGGSVLLDGLVASASPDVVASAASRLRLTALVHLPLGVETPEARSAEREVLRACRTVVATSGWTREWLVGHYAGLEVRNARPGVDPAPLAFGSPAGGALLCVGRAGRAKGYDVLAAALRALTDLAWTCEWAGPVGAVDPVDSVDADRIRLLGPLAPADLAERYASSDLLVLPSRVETYGMVLTEALARGVPVLASDVGGVREAVGSGGAGRLPGILVPPGDPDALADALRRWLTDGGLRTELREAARERRGTLRGWDATADDVADALPGPVGAQS